MGEAVEDAKENAIWTVEIRLKHYAHTNEAHCRFLVLDGHVDDRKRKGEEEM